MTGCVAITVGQLIDVPDLRTWVHAGRRGLAREISWAHVCELADPTEWLSAGELVLTTGLGIPEAAEDQRAYIERLADADLSGVAIGDRMSAPELSAEMSQAADDRSLPLLLTAYEVPFTAVARMVAEANRSEEHARLLETVRLYEISRDAAIKASGRDLLEQLGRIVGCSLHLLDHDRGLPLLGGVVPAPEVVDALRAAAASRGEPLPAVLRLKVADRSIMAVAVPSSRPATMLAVPDGVSLPDLALLRHVAGLAAQEIEREGTERERRRRLGGELLAGLIDGRFDADSAAQPLAERGLDQEPRVVAACGLEGHERQHADVHLRLDDRGVAHLLLQRAPLLFSLLRDDAAELAAFREEIDERIAIGLSDPLGRVTRVPDASREARWALESARAARRSIVRYGEDAPSLFLPRGLSEAERAVRHVLGDLLDYDATHEADLVRSLRVFLSRNRSWKEAAAELHIHKQTLVYRMRRVEELTGRRLDDTDSVAELWFALKAAQA
jgi:PucR family transcriptional regulator, purine catabolism regulatory protein